MAKNLASPAPIESLIRQSVQAIDDQIAMAEDYLRILRRQRQDLIQLEQRQGIIPSFSPKGKAIDAIETYLRRESQPKTAEEIVAAMVDWGVNANVRDQEQQIYKSINYNLLSQADKKKKWPKRTATQPRLKHFGSKIGLSEWEEGKFPQKEK